MRTLDHKMCSLKKAEKHTTTGFMSSIQRMLKCTVFLTDTEVREFFTYFFCPLSIPFKDDFQDSRSRLSLLIQVSLYPSPSPHTIIWRLRLMLCVTFLGQESRDCRMMTAFGRGPERKIYSLPCRCLVRWASAFPHPLQSARGARGKS